jgi:glycosyltransferase involved in cell wall biosynthesis
MTIGYVLKMYPRFSETFILNEILELERQGTDVRIFSLRKPDDGRFHAGLARVRAPVTYLPEYPFADRAQIFSAHRALARSIPRRYRQVLLYAFTRGNLHAIKRFWQAGVLAHELQNRPVSHLHAHFATSATRVAMLVNMLIGTPYSFTAHAKDIFLNTVSHDTLRDKIRMAEFVVTVSDFNREYLTEIGHAPGESNVKRFVPPAGLQIPNGRIRRLYNGIDVDQFDTGSDVPIRESGIPLILGVGRLVEKKGFDVLVHACALLRDRKIAFRCDIVGKGPQEHALRQLIAELKLEDRVHLIGPRSQDALVTAYREAAIFALPCVVGADGNRDGLPTVLLEAMAMQLPVVSTDVTGVPEIVDDSKTGFVVPQNSAAAIAVALEHLLNDRTLRERMGAAGRERVLRDFNLHTNVAVLRRWLTSSQPIPEPSPRPVGETLATVETQP